jgi:outer membrane receptor protein involved in Fe transport
MRLAISALLVSLLLSGYAQAQTPASEGSSGGPVVAKDASTAGTDGSDPAQDVLDLDDFVVRAGKRGLAIEETPGSVEAISGDKLESMKAQKLSDFLKLVPGVVLTERGADQNIPVIRGISSSNSGTGNQFSPLTVGIYVDDMPFTDLYVPFSQPDVNPFDLESVEILKGPQGTLFGSGALSGAIRYILKKPAPYLWEGKLGATFTSTDESNGLSPVYAGALNIPVFDGAALRVVGVSREHSGLYDDIDRELEDQDKLDQTTFRVLGTWQVDDRLTLNGFYFTQDSEQGNGFANNPMGFYRESSGTGVIESAFSGTNFLLSYEFDNFTFQSSSNYQTKDVLLNALGPVSVGSQQTGDPDGDGGYNGPGSEDVGIYDVSSGYLESHTETIFQEFRLYTPPGGEWLPTSWMSLSWIAGIAYQNSRQSYEQDSDLIEDIVPVIGLVDLLPIFPLDTPIGPISGSQDTSYLYAELDSEAEEASIYAEGTARLWEKFELTLGARFYKTDLEAQGFLSGVQILALDAGNTRAESMAGVHEQGVNPKVSLRYLFNDRVQVYALAARGFQFGGVQLNPPVTALALADPASFDSFKSSNLWNYEVGLRTEFFDRALRFDITLFHLDWEDLQITVRKPLVDAPLFENIYEVGFIENVGSAESQGVEAAISVRPTKGLTFTSSAYWGDARTTEDFSSTSGDVPAGSRLPVSPHFQIANQLTYVTDDWRGWQAGFGITHAHIGRAYNNLLYTREQGGYDTIDLSFNLLQSRWAVVPDLTVSVINVTDVRGVAGVSGGPSSSNYAYYFTRPRSVVMSLGLQF